MIALFGSGFYTAESIAAALAVENPEALAAFTAFANEVLESSNPVVRDCLRWGVPKYCAAFLPTGIVMKCRSCGAKLTAVPCGLCGRKTLSDPLPNEREEPDIPLLEPTVPTLAPPGSPEKIEVMANRVARGEAPCHPDDRLYGFTPDPINDLGILPEAHGPSPRGDIVANCHKLDPLRLDLCFVEESEDLDELLEAA